jgi:hypothetical protein
MPHIQSHFSAPVFRHLLLALVALALVLGACALNLPGTSSATSVSADMRADKGGSIVHPNGATLTIPPGALSTDAHVTLTDSGKARAPTGSVLSYISDVFIVETKDANGKRVPFAKPAATLSIKPSGFDTSKTLDLVIATTDVDHPRTIHMIHSMGLKDGEGLKETALTLKLVVPGAKSWIVRLPRLPAGTTLNADDTASTTGASLDAASTPLYATASNGALAARAPTTTTTPYLHVPFYHQDLLPWCVPTSLTEMLNYYSLWPRTGDPLNNTLGHTNSLANWQLAGANHEPSTSGAFYSQLNAIGIPEGNQEEIQWDPTFIPDHPSPQNDFDAYVFATAGSGAALAAQQHPLMLNVALAWQAAGWRHSLVIVGSDQNGLYLHDSNGFIGVYKTWGGLNHVLRDDYQQVVAPGSNYDIDGSGQDLHTDPGGNWFVHIPFVMTLSMVGNPTVRPEEERQGSLVLTQDQLIDAADGQPGLKLKWEGADGHDHGYYWAYQARGFVQHPDDSANLGAPAGHGATLHFQYTVANVGDQQQTYTSTIELSGPDYGGNPVRQTFTSIVPAHAMGGSLDSNNRTMPISGTIQLPAQGSEALLVVKLFVNGSTTRTQDVKFLRIPLGGHDLPQVSIHQPVSGTHTRQGLPLELLAGTALQSDGSSWADSRTLVWKANGTQFATGSTAMFPATTPGQYTISLTGTDRFGYTSSDQISAIVDSTTPTTLPTVRINSPLNFLRVNVGDTVGFSVTALQDGIYLPDSAITWTINGTPVHTGASFAYSFSSPGTMTINASATNSAGLRAGQTITLYVTSASTWNPPIVSIVQPDASHLHVYVPDGQPTASVHFVASGSPAGLQYDWSDSVQGHLGSGPDITAGLYDHSLSCTTDHVVTVRVTDSHAFTNIASVTVHVHACIP